MADNELTLSARISELETQVAELQGHLTQINQSVAQGNCLTIWQFISFTLVMAGTLFGTLAWISTSLREEIRLTRNQLQMQIQQSERNTSDRFTQMEKRFEDLRQVVLSQQKQRPPKRRVNSSAESLRARRKGERKTYATLATINSMLMTPTSAAGTRRVMQMLGRRYVRYINHAYQKNRGQTAMALP
jgi:DNA anti-recombination protein RmuC